MTRTVDLTPTWAGLMPALIAALQHGTGEGPAIAAAELTRLAGLVDSNNARAKEEAAKAEAMAQAIETARLCLFAYPAADLDRQKGGAAWRSTATDIRAALADLVTAIQGPLPCQACGVFDAAAYTGNGHVCPACAKAEEGAAQ